MSRQPMRLSEDAATEPAREMRSPSVWRFRLAVLRYDRAVFRLARDLLRDAREAEDVTQEAFLRFWQHGARVERPREWLLRVARNASLTRLRRAGRLVSHDPAELPDVGEARDPAWHYQQDALAGRLSRLVDELPEPQRSLVLLFDMQGLDGASCARVLGLNENQVKVYLHRARRRLRQRLEESR